MAVKVPVTLAHLHYWSVELTRPASRAEMLAAFRTSSRIALIRYGDGLPALKVVTKAQSDGKASIALTDAAMGVGAPFWTREAQPAARAA